jgi:N-acetylmuramoyl-L-alanine amidase
MDTYRFITSFRLLGLALFWVPFCLSIAATARGTGIATVATATTEAYYETKALAGDGVYSILRRYQLDGYRCNFDKFYALNKMNKNTGLRVGKSYQLPIQVYDFDGRTIRSTTGDNDWNKAVKIRDYNLALVEQGVLESNYGKSMKLLVPYHIDNCENEAIAVTASVATDPEEAVTDNPEPGNTEADNASGTGRVSSSGGRRMFPIFGTQYAYTPLASTKLRGKVFYVVSGHGGPDPGAIGKRGNNQLCEDEYAYDVSLRLCRNLIAHGATAYMINRDPNDGIRNDKYLECDQDEVIWGGIRQSPNQKRRLTQRSDVINELYEKHLLQGVTEQKVIVVHVDSRSHSQRTDLFFYHHPSSEEGRELARQMQETMRQKYRRYRSNGEYHGTVTARDLHMLRECKPTTVYVELANIRNDHDQQRIVIQRNRELLADWMLEGLMNNQ